MRRFRKWLIYIIGSIVFVLSLYILYRGFLIAGENGWGRSSFLAGLPGKVEELAADTYNGVLTWETETELGGEPKKSLARRILDGLFPPVQEEGTEEEGEAGSGAAGSKTDEGVDGKNPDGAIEGSPASTDENSNEGASPGDGAEGVSGEDSDKNAISQGENTDGTGGRSDESSDKNTGGQGENVAVGEGALGETSGKNENSQGENGDGSEGALGETSGKNENSQGENAAVAEGALGETSGKNTNSQGENAAGAEGLLGASSGNNTKNTDGGEALYGEDSCGNLIDTSKQPDGDAAENTAGAAPASSVTVFSNSAIPTPPAGSMRQAPQTLPWASMQDFNFLLNSYFILDMSTTIDEELLNLDSLMGKNLTIDTDTEGPQILIYHTHSQESFIDSRTGDIRDTIVGVGERLKEILTDQYGFSVLHHTKVYDMIDGKLDRNKAYNLAAPDIAEILEAYPSIQVVIDLHRDGVDDYKFVTEFNGKPTAMIMFYNGLSRTALNGPVDYLPNPYIADNLALSFQLQMKAAEYYPGFTRNIYLQSLRYNQHLCPKSLLIESGTQLNTVEEEYNAMEPLADILNQVLRGE